MKTQLLAFGLVLSLLFTPAFAQEESFLDDDTSADAGGEDLFGGDFFSDLDSFLEQEETTDEEIEVEELELEPLVLEETPEPVVLEPVEEEATLEEDLQSSAQGQPGALPGSAQVNLSVINVSQDNANATQVGARPGDVLRYEISLNSAVEDVVDYIPSINVAGLNGAVEFTNTGFGVLEGGNVVYPAYSHQAPCEQVFTFFVRILEDCGSMTSVSASADGAGSVSVPLNCGLSETGPTQRWFLLAGMIMLLVTLMFGFTNRKTS